MYKSLDTTTWNRKETFDYFGSFEYPFFNITSNLDISVLYRFCKEKAYSINHALHFCSLLAGNEAEAFRIRYKDGEVVVFDQIDGGATLLLEDHSIRFCLYAFSTSYQEFARAALESEEQVRRTRKTDIRTGNPDVIHYSVVPWIGFTSISHPRTNMAKDSIPKITFGKYFEAGQQILIPVSVEVNHALMDGYHVSNFLSIFEEKMNRFAGGLYA